MQASSDKALRRAVELCEDHLHNVGLDLARWRRQPSRGNCSGVNVNVNGGEAGGGSGGGGRRDGGKRTPGRLPLGLPSKSTTAPSASGWPTVSGSDGGCAGCGTAADEFPPLPGSGTSSVSRGRGGGKGCGGGKGGAGGKGGKGLGEGKGGAATGAGLAALLTGSADEVSEPTEASAASPEDFPSLPGASPSQGGRGRGGSKGGGGDGKGGKGSVAKGGVAKGGGEGAGRGRGRGARHWPTSSRWPSGQKM